MLKLGLWERMLGYSGSMRGRLRAREVMKGLWPCQPLHGTGAKCSGSSTAQLRPLLVLGIKPGTSGMQVLCATTVLAPCWEEEASHSLSLLWGSCKSDPRLVEGHCWVGAVVLGGQETAPWLSMDLAMGAGEPWAAL